MDVWYRLTGVDVNDLVVDVKGDTLLTLADVCAN